MSASATLDFGGWPLQRTSRLTGRRPLQLGQEVFQSAATPTADLADTLRSYGWVSGGPRRALTDWIPEPHRGFLARCLPYYETRSHLFVHAGFVPELPLDEQPGLALRWRVTDPNSATPHHSGKVAVVGHTPQHTGEVLNLGFLVCIDTNCARGGWLTALDTDTGQIWQTNQAGRLRTGRLSQPGA